ncbi:hypothetical protein CP965_13885 [Halarcobacter mediterraneus]|uniref:Uncharacterized protein n=1 Tax=Halarcobacter mediterraneus TaxID=2023153 RepID=A0A4Q1AVN5_9BACT|nr:hypothetical protein [Halarcobacter mediterraneus]RXK11460.1 hypothetical protein CP965_13885 [Halarcobacter mediterraneus]
MKLDKSSFTLLETIISTLILSIIIVGFSNSFFYDNLDEEYILLNKLENNFTTSSYSSDFAKQNKNLTLKINETQTKTITVKEIEYKDNKIRLKKYEM